MKKLLLFCVGLLVMGGGWLFLTKTSQKSVFSVEEKNAAMAKILNRDPVLNDKKIAAWQEYQGKYIHFSYPDDALLHINQTKQANVLESLSFSLPVDHINLTIQVVNTSLADYPGLTLRRNDKENYKESQGKIDKIDSLVFTKQGDGVEKTVFFEANNKLFTIAVSGYNMDDVEDFYTKFIASVGF